MNTEPFFLDDDDIIALTGYVRADKQREHLKRIGVPFFTDMKGRPRIPRNAFRLVAVPARFRIIDGDVEYRTPYPLPPKPDNSGDA